MGLRERIWKWLGPPPVEAIPIVAVGLSEDKLPLHLPPPACPICHELAETLQLRQRHFFEQHPDTGILPHFCDDCGEAIPVLENMDGAGYQSQTWNHMHIYQSTSSGQWMKCAAYRELCPACYRIDWTIRY